MTTSVESPRWIVSTFYRVARRRQRLYLSEPIAAGDMGEWVAEPYRGWAFDTKEEAASALADLHPVTRDGAQVLTVTVRRAGPYTVSGLS
jgi:hypothetical protein